MPIRYNTTNPNNWQLVDNRTLTAEPTPIAGRFEPIPPYLSVVTLSGQAILVQASSSDSKPSWFTGGWIYQINQTDLVFPLGTPQTICEKAYKFYLNNRTFITFPEDLSPYLLRVSIPPWIKNISIKIWEYIGDVIEPCDEKLDEIIVQLSNLEQQIEDCCNELKGNNPTITKQRQAGLGLLNNFL